MKFNICSSGTENTTKSGLTITKNKIKLGSRRGERETVLESFAKIVASQGAACPRLYTVGEIDLIKIV